MGAQVSCCQSDTRPLEMKSEEVESHLPTLMRAREAEQEEVICDVAMAPQTSPKDIGKVPATSAESPIAECSTEADADSPATAQVFPTPAPSAALSAAGEFIREGSPCVPEEDGQEGKAGQMAQVASAVMTGYATFQESETKQRVMDGASKAAATASSFAKGFKDAIKETEIGAKVSSQVKRTPAGRGTVKGARDLFAAVKAGVERAAGSMDCTEYTVLFDKSAGKKLGVTIDSETLCISSEIGEGLIKDWNGEESSNTQVSTGHRIVEVNGIRSKEALLAELQQNKILQVKLSKPKELVEVEVVLDKAGEKTRLGVTLTGERRPTLKSVACDGLAYGKLQVGDQILSINGWKADGHSETAERMKQLGGTLRIQVLRKA